MKKPKRSFSARSASVLNDPQELNNETDQFLRPNKRQLIVAAYSMAMNLIEQTTTSYQRSRLFPPKRFKDIPKEKQMKNILMRWHLITTFVYLIPCLAWSQSTDSKISASPIAMPHRLGEGRYSTTMASARSCFDPTSVEEQKTQSEESVTHTMEELSSFADLDRALSVDANGQLDAMVSLKLKAALAYNSQQNRELKSYIILYKIKVPKERIAIKTERLKLSRNSLALLQKGPSAFYEVCGDEFIKEQEKGGNFIALLKITTKTESDLSNLKAEVHAKAFSKLDANLSASLKNIAKSGSRDISLTVVKQGDSKLVSLAGVEDISSYVSTFISAMDSSASLAVLETKYSDYRGYTKEAVATPQLVAIQKAKLLYKQAYLDELSENVDYALTHQDTARKFSKTPAELIAIKRDLQELKFRLQECMATLVGCRSESIQPPKLNLPSAYQEVCVDKAYLCNNDAMADMTIVPNVHLPKGVAEMVDKDSDRAKLEIRPILMKIGCAEKCARFDGYCSGSDKNSSCQTEKAVVDLGFIGAEVTTDFSSCTGRTTCRKLMKIRKE